MKNLFLKIRKAILVLIFVPIMVTGYLIYLISKPIRALGYLMMTYKNSAKEELRDFFSTSHSIGDF